MHESLSVIPVHTMVSMSCEVSEMYGGPCAEEADPCADEVRYLPFLRIVADAVTRVGSVSIEICDTTHTMPVGIDSPLMVTVAVPDAAA